MAGNVNGERDILFVNASWGLGLGIIVNGELYTGRSGFAGEMLETAGDALTLTAPDPSCRQRTGYQRILRKIFKVSSTQGIPLDVGTRSQNHAYVLIPRLLGNCPAFFREQIFIKRARRHGR